MYWWFWQKGKVFVGLLFGTDAQALAGWGDLEPR
jgi:hypothetical protein